MLVVGRESTEGRAGPHRTRSARYQAARTTRDRRVGASPVRARCRRAAIIWCNGNGDGTIDTSPSYNSYRRPSSGHRSQVRVAHARNAAFMVAILHRLPLLASPCRAEGQCFLSPNRDGEHLLTSLHGSQRVARSNAVELVVTMSVTSKERLLRDGSCETLAHTPLTICRSKAPCRCLVGGGDRSPGAPDRDCR